MAVTAILVVVTAILVVVMATPVAAMAILVAGMDRDTLAGVMVMEVVVTEEEGAMDMVSPAMRLIVGVVTER